MPTPKPPAKKTSTPRVDKLRAERERLGLRRRELFSHDSDWPALRAYSRAQNEKRAKGKK